MRPDRRPRAGRVARRAPVRRMGGDARRRAARRRVRVLAARRPRGAGAGRARAAASPSTSRSRSRARSPTAWRWSRPGRRPGACARSGTSGAASTSCPRPARRSPVRHPGLLVSRSFGPTEPARADLGAAAAGSWFADPRQSGGILFELASHDIDLQLALAGRVDSVQASATAGRLALAGREAGGLHDTVSVLLRFSGGGLGTVSAGWTSEGSPPLYTLDVLAAEATLALDLDPDYRLRGRARGRDLDVSETADARRRSQQRFFAAVAAGRPGRGRVHAPRCAWHARGRPRLRDGDRHRAGRARPAPRRAVRSRAGPGSAAGRRSHRCRRARRCRCAGRRGSRPPRSR